MSELQEAILEKKSRLRYHQGSWNRCSREESFMAPVMARAALY